MTLEERIEDLVSLVGDGDLYSYEASEIIFELAEDFAIEFGQWLLNQPYRVKYNDKKELLEIYKKHYDTKRKIRRISRTVRSIKRYLFSRLYINSNRRL